MNIWSAVWQRQVLAWVSTGKSISIKNEIASGRYGSASEVVRDALRAMEERKSKLYALRSHLARGAIQAESGEFADDFTMDALISELDNEA